MARHAFLVLVSTIWTSLAVPANATPGPQYCLGIRGNGENISAHWGALGRIIEEIGMPSGAAGGSSASVSLFMMESVQQNPLINGIRDDVQRRRAQSLLFKSMAPYISHVMEFENVISGYKFIQELAASKSPWKESLMAAIKAAQNNADIYRAFTRFAPMVNPDLLVGLQDPSSFQFYKEQIMDALRVFGKFDAQNDQNLFVRPGLVDFKYFALWLGMMGDFYAGHLTTSEAAKMKTFVHNCSNMAYRRSWSDPALASCRATFKELVREYGSKGMGQFPHRRLFEKIGTGTRLKIFPTTSIVDGKADHQRISVVDRYQALLQQFRAGNRNVDYKSFTLDFHKELAFGYWGPTSQDLAHIQKNLDPSDLKSSKFRALGPANWFEVLSTSPAEPGLANFQKIPVDATWAQVSAEISRRGTGFNNAWSGLRYRQALSAGGWSDLHPTLVLKAYGCEDIVYLSRQDGDSVFGQQVFIRLVGLTGRIPFWTQMGENDPAKIRGAVGTNRLGWQVKGTSAENTPWDMISNLGNERSSFNTSVGAATAVYCTDWNRFDPFKGENAALVEESYRAPVFVKPGADSRFQINPAPRNFDRRKDYPGCLSPAQRRNY